MGSTSDDFLSRRICSQCHYDLAGLSDEHACPECGTVPEVGRVVIPGWGGRERPTRRGLVINLIVMFATAYVVIDGFANGRTTKDYLFAGAMAVVFITSASYTVVYVRRAMLAAEGRTEGTLLIDDDGVELLAKAGAEPQGPLAFVSGYHASGGARLTFTVPNATRGRRRASFYVEGDRAQSEALMVWLKQRQDTATDSG